MPCILIIELGQVEAGHLLGSRVPEEKNKQSHWPVGYLP